jgi:glycosyltransferase involved in cell wall biosynthesis
LATRDETQGLVLLEAMSTGIPVVTTEAVPQNVRIDKACFIAPIDDVEAIADKMCEVMQLTDGEGEVFSKIVAEKVSPQVIAAQLETVLRDCM